MIGLGVQQREGIVRVELRIVLRQLGVHNTNKPVINYKSAMKSDSKKFKKLFLALLKKGIFVAPSQFEVVFLSTAHTKSDFNEAINAYQYALKMVKK